MRCENSGEWKGFKKPEKYDMGMSSVNRRFMGTFPYYISEKVFAEKKHLCYSRDTTFLLYSFLSIRRTIYDIAEQNSKKKATIRE